MKRLLALALLACCAAATSGPDTSAGDAERTAGDATVFADGKNAFSFPAANLDNAERTRFAIGNSFFKRNWVQAPASTTARDGLGPHFIARSCGACHAFDGRGEPPSIKNRLSSEQPVDLLIRLSIPGSDPTLGVVPEPTYGDQFNNAAVDGVKPEGQVAIRYEPVHGQYKDGTRFTLMRPVYSFSQLNYGPMHPDTRISPRIAPQLIGVGLLEAIPDSSLLDNVNSQAKRTDGISGRLNRVHDAYTGQERLGRFGWKANVATLMHQTAGAFAGDIGITSSLFPKEPCTSVQADCLSAPRGGKPGQPEIDERGLAEVVFYQATLAPPAARAVKNPEVVRGRALFHEAQCAACHRPSYTTGPVPFPTLSSHKLENQLIWPYTDLLLHDMGDGLADGRDDFLANGREWKTPPLWGIGLIKSVNGHTRLLHDGRANGVEEAILWHGGEAEASQSQFRSLSKADRAALIKFVESL
ncbi:MAG: di-heme oxidoredictase family protein [Limnobacter sp.]|uniref:di-heme oxidoreductase family protein n=1 Tax=Limnobacter sp. TaxID=2003368 RepID=UPI00391DC19F